MTQLRITLIEGADAIGKAIDSITKRGKALDKDIHVAAMSAANHFAQHGDVTFINKLYNGMPKGARHAAMTLWLTTFAGVQANSDKAKAKNLPFIKDKAKAVDLEGGDKRPWFLLKPSPAPAEVLDVLKLTLALIEKAKKAAAEDGPGVQHGAMLEKLEALAEEFQGEEPATADADPLAGIEG